MAATALHIGRRHEGGADQQEHRGLILPISWRMEGEAREHRIGQDKAGQHQGDGGAEDDQPVEQRDRPLQRPEDGMRRPGRRQCLLFGETVAPPISNP